MLLVIALKCLAKYTITFQKSSADCLLCPLCAEQIIGMLLLMRASQESFSHRVCVCVCVRARPNIGGLQQKASCSLCCFLLSFCIQFLQGIADQSEPHNCSWKALPFLLKTNCYYIVPKPLSDIKDSRKRLGGGVHGSCTVHPRQRF